MIIASGSTSSGEERWVLDIGEALCKQLEKLYSEQEEWYGVMRDWKKGHCDKGSTK